MKEDFYQVNFKTFIISLDSDTDIFNFSLGSTHISIFNNLLILNFCRNDKCFY